MLVIHIGWGKSGSTTIQELTVQHRDWFADHGVICPEVDPSGNHIALYDQLLTPDGPQDETLALRRLAEEHADGHVFASSEFLIGLSRASVERLRELLADMPVRILFYLREYPSWLVSHYGQTVKKGATTLDFAAFFQSRVESLTVVPHLTNWGEVFGWDRLRVRTLDRNVLTAGDLTHDLLDALGIADLPPPVASQNTTPSWAGLELMRNFYAGCEHSVPRPVRPRRTLRKLVPVLDSFAEWAGGAPTASYMDAEMWQTAAALYQHDLERINDLLGTAFVMRGSPPAPAPAPNLMLIPAAARRRFAKRVGLMVEAGNIGAVEAGLLTALPAFEAFG